MNKPISSAAGIAPWRRHALLAIAIVFLAVGLPLSWQAETADRQFAPGVLLKVGIVLFMLWLALPQLQRLNPWLMASVGVLALVAVVRPQLLLLLPRIALPLAPVLLLVWLFWIPKKKKRSRGP